MFNFDDWRLRIAAWAGVVLLAVGVIVTFIMTGWVAGVTVLGFLVASVAFLMMKGRLPALFDLLFVIAALLNSLGWAWNWFTEVPLYDELVHAYTVFAISLALGLLVFFSMRAHFRTHGWLYIITIASFGVMLGTGWEIFEWTIGVIVNLRNAMTDLMMNLVGALLAGVVALFALRWQPQDQLHE